MKAENTCCSDSLSHGTVRSIAISTGEWTSIVVREVSTHLQKNKGHRPKALQSAIDDLCAQSVFSAEECQKLKRIVDCFFQVVRGKDVDGSLQGEIDRFLASMLSDAGSSSAAIAVASAASRNTKPQCAFPMPNENGVAFARVTITPETTGAGAITGAVIGAGVGAAVGGAVGAGIGAAIGAAAGAAIGFSNENEV